MHSSCRSDSDTLKLLSPPETFVLELPTRIDKPHQSCSASWPSNVVSNSANIPQSHNESTELASCRRATSANIGNKGTSVFRDPRVSRLEHVSASDQQSPREPHPADPDRLPTTILAPVSSRTISGRGDTDGLGVDLVSPSRDGQVSPWCLLLKSSLVAFLCRHPLVQATIEALPSASYFHPSQ